MQNSERDGLRARLPLYRYFCDFYALLVEQKRALAAAPDGLAAQTRAPGLAPAVVQTRLLEQLNAQYGTVQQDCTAEQRALYDDARYAMAALADEQLLLDVDWPGRSEWLGLMLESALFDTRIAGVHFYRLIDRLLAVPMPGEAHAELGMVLLGSLEVGFRGELRGVHEAGRLAQRRNELVKFVREVRGDQPGSRAFEQAYEHTIGPSVPEPADCRLAPLSPWFNAARLALLAYLLVSAAIWFITLHPFRVLVADDPTAQQVRDEKKQAQSAADAGNPASDPSRASVAVSISSTPVNPAVEAGSLSTAGARVNAGSTGSAVNPADASSVPPAPANPVVAVRAPVRMATTNSPQGGVQ
jgi:type VI secretion system protein ImpK